MNTFYLVCSIHMKSVKKTICGFTGGYVPQFFALNHMICFSQVFGQLKQNKGFGQSQASCSPVKDMRVVLILSFDSPQESK